ncbi:hypothetical protein ACGRHY_18880 [Streptomyces sp. HK10]|uniref:hypothetical protein n=1 Tax=Streptomyces sp. HK10 TaxID=3373255 RepID=UPI003747C9F2
MTPNTPKLSEQERAPWLRKLDRATGAHEKARKALDALIADARRAGVPLTAISEHTPYSREWARRIADQVDAERAEAQGAAESEGTTRAQDAEK